MQNRYSQQREAVLLEKDFKFESVAIIVENNDFGLTFRKNMVALMQKAGKKVVLDVTQDRNDTNWYATITRIPASKPDLVIVSISAVQAANFVKQYAEAGITTPLFSDYPRSEEHTSELQSPDHLVCRLLLEKKKKYIRASFSVNQTTQNVRHSVPILKTKRIALYQ